MGRRRAVLTVEYDQLGEYPPTSWDWEGAVEFHWSHGGDPGGVVRNVRVEVQEDGAMP